MTRPPIPALILESSVVAVARHLAPDAAPRVGAALASGGVPVMEITLNEPRAEALGAVGALAQAAPSFGGLVGAGTVRFNLEIRTFRVVDTTVKEVDVISLDGTTGEVMRISSSRR